MLPAYKTTEAHFVLAREIYVWVLGENQEYADKTSAVTTMKDMKARTKYRLKNCKQEGSSSLRNLKEVGVGAKGDGYEDIGRIVKPGHCGDLMDHRPTHNVTR